MTKLFSSHHEHSKGEKMRKNKRQKNTIISTQAPEQTINPHFEKGKLNDIINVALKWFKINFKRKHQSLSKKDWMKLSKKD